MENEKIKAESDDIRTPFKEFIRKFKKQKTALVAFAFIILLVIIAIISYSVVPYGINEYDYVRSCRAPVRSTGLVPMSSDVICSHVFSAVPEFP